MKVFPTKRLLAALILVIVAPAQAQTLSSELLVEQVLQANAALKSSASQRDAEQLRARYASAFDDPVLSYSIAPETIGSAIGTRHIVQFSQLVPTRGKLGDRGELAASRVDMASSSLANQQAQLVAAARIAWTEWWYVHRALTLNAANQRVLRQLVPLTEAVYSTGKGLQQDILQAQTRSERIRLEAVRLRQQKRRLQARINALRGDLPGTPVNSPGDLPAWKKLPNSEWLYDRLATSDARFAKLAARARAAKAKHTLAKKAFTPDIRTSIGYIGTLDPDEKRLQFGLSFSLPLNRQRLRAAADAANAERHRIAFETADLEARISAELAQALSMADEATEASVIYRQSLIPKTRQTLAAAQADYESSAGEFSNVITAESQLLELQLELARTRADWRVAIAMVERITAAGLWDMANSTPLGEPRIATTLEGGR